jgi:hypothetical protein
MNWRQLIRREVSRFGETIRLSSDLANPLSKRQHQRADSDGCVGPYLNQPVEQESKLAGEW